MMMFFRSFVCPPYLTPGPSPFASAQATSNKQERGKDSGKILIGFFILTFGLIGCGDNVVENTSSDGNINSLNVADTCNCIELVVDSLGTHLLDDKLYTGICLSYYSASYDKYIEKNLFEGKLHGKVIYYDKDGAVLFEEVYENGKQKRNGALDETLTCDCAELEHVKTSDPLVPTLVKLDDIPFTGKCEKYYENSEQLYMESDYKNGYLEGYTIYYNKDGSTILMEKYSYGQMISTVN